MGNDKVILKTTRESVFASLKQFDHLSKDSHFIEITEWTNGEGFDLTIESFNSVHVPISYGQFNAMKKLVKELEKSE